MVSAVDVLPPVAVEVVWLPLPVALSVVLPVVWLGAAKAIMLMLHAMMPAHNNAKNLFMSEILLIFHCPMVVYINKSLISETGISSTSTACTR